MAGGRIEEFLASKAIPQNLEERLKLIEQVAHMGLGELRWEHRPGKLFMEGKVQELIEKIGGKSSVFAKGGAGLPSRIEEFLASKTHPQTQEEQLKLMEQVAHIGLGELRWEKRPGRVFMTEMKEIRAQELLEKILITKRGEFMVAGIDLDFGEALRTRLKEGTNHKRGAAESNLEPFQQLQFRTTTVDDQPELSPTNWSSSENPGTAACARQRRFVVTEHENHPTVVHDAYAMSGRSPGRRKRRHSSVRPGIDNNSAIDTKPSSASVQEILDSADEYVSLSVGVGARLSLEPSARPAMKFEIANNQ
jgi:hypothetical protein